MHFPNLTIIKYKGTILFQIISYMVNKLIFLPIDPIVTDFNKTILLQSLNDERNI